ncbi:MAG: hypothetical protein ROW39_07265 [Anaerolineaceae bacterium]|jgi:hypothetical protein
MMHLAVKFLLLLILLLSACAPRQAAEPDIDEVATAVQATLDAQPTQTPFPPTDTPEPVIATFTPEQPTPTVFFTETPTLTPTVSTEDPLSYLGQPTGKDTLESGSGFGIDAGGYEDDFTRISVSEGSMFIHNFSTIGWRGWRMRPPKLKNAYIEGVFSTHGCIGVDQYGLVVRAPDYDSGHGYYFALTCDGRFNLVRWTEAGTSVVVNNTQSDAIRAGSGQVNRVGILLRDDNIRLYINGRIVHEVNDNALPEGGYFGPFVSGVSGTMVIALDEIAYWTLP